MQDWQGPDGVNTGGVYKSTDRGETWTRINSLNPRPFYFSLVRVDPTDDKYHLRRRHQSLQRSTDGGKKFSHRGHQRRRCMPISTPCGSTRTTAST